MVDWTQQWANFCPYFKKDGKAHIPLSSHGTLKLLPGPGFGDLSHPTTRIALKLMQEAPSFHSLLDIGCGSGILTLAGALMGANKVVGIDIDTDALNHARQNAHLNDLNERISFHTSLAEAPSLKFPLLVSMNMIYSEQAIYWPQMPPQAHLIVSGILRTQKNNYLQLISPYNWSLLSEKQEEGWLGFLFKI